MTTAFLTDVTGFKAGAPVSRAGVTLIPIFAPGRRVNDLTVAGDELVVTELETPTVPQLQVHNPTERELLIPAGKILRGGHQTRVVNVSIVVPAGATIVIPVSCVEAGRWSGGSRFADSQRLASRRVRAAKQRSVARNVREHKSKLSAQGEVWGTISSELRSRDVDARGELILELYEDQDRHGERALVVKSFIDTGVQPGQVGVAVANGGRILGLEVFPSTDALRSSWEAIVRAAVLDADEFGVPSTDSDSDIARGLEALEKFLADVAAGAGTISDGVGRGTEVHVETPSYVAHGLRVDGELVYCNAFAS